MQAKRVSLAQRDWRPTGRTGRYHRTPILTLWTSSAQSYKQLRRTRESIIEVAVPPLRWQHIFGLTSCQLADQHARVRCHASASSGDRLSSTPGAAPGCAALDQVLDAAERAPVVVWFKHDLRVDDHPGLTAALASGAPVTPFYCFNPACLTQLLREPDGLAGLRRAVQGLRAALRARGSGLVVRQGPVQELLPAFVAETGAVKVVAEREIEFRWWSATDAVRRALPQGVQLQCWQLDLYADEPYCSNFKEYQRRRGEVQAPLEAPRQLPALPGGIDEGEMPALADLEAATIALDADRRESAVQQVAEALRQACSAHSPSSIIQELLADEAAVRQALRTYLGCQEADTTSGEPLAGRLAEAVLATELPSTPLGSFPALFNPAMVLGVLSRRRLYHEAMRHAALRRRRGPLAALVGEPVTVRAAAGYAEAADFHWHLAEADRMRDTKTGAAPRHWRWRGFLTDYYTAECGEPRPGRPAFLLVHGFGAFGEQWRGQIAALTAAGYEVFAPTLPGYGRAEKPVLAYSQELWRDFLRDFIVEVVRRPVVLAGNSIGGYIGAATAADYPTLVRGLVLLNTAGQVDTSYVPPEDASIEVRNIVLPRAVVEVVSRGLFLFLEKSIARQLARLYPGDPTNADDWLADEIYRAACDPGALGVFRSVFYLPKPWPLNHLVAGLYGGPTLMLQGRLDPLNDAPGRAAALAAACPNVTVQLIEAGHCPQDEKPALVNERLVNFMEELVMAGAVASPQPAIEAVPLALER